MKKLAVIFTGTLFTLLSLSAYAGTETLRDSSGRSIGTSQVNGSKTEYRDGSNRHIKDITSSSSEKKVFVKDGKIQFFK